MDEFKLRRGLKNVYAAEVTNDDNGVVGYTTGTPFHVIPAGTMSRDKQVDINNVWFDDGVFATSGTEGATTIAITGASLRVNDIARITGKTVDTVTGVVLDSGDYVEKYFALLGEAEGLDGSSEWFVFHKGTFTIASIEDKTKDDTTDANGMTLNFNAIKTKHVFSATNKTSKCIHLDTTVTAFKTGKSWTAQVVTPDNVSTIVEKLVQTTGVTVTPTTAAIAVNGTTALTAALTPSGATGTITWATSNAAVATVDANGTVTGKSAGSAVITAVCGQFSASCTVTVSE